jgi:hypothetical protein
VHTPPADLPESVLRAALERHWSLRVEALIYRPVGFGSHHWELTDPTGARLFVTVDDLRTRRIRSGEPLIAGCDRLRASLAAAQALRAAGHDFVVAPVPTHDGEPLARLADSFTVAVYPFVVGESFDWDAYPAQHRGVALDLLLAVHSASPLVRSHALTDGYAIPFRDVLIAALDAGPASRIPDPTTVTVHTTTTPDPSAVTLETNTGDPDLGPYARPAAELLAQHAPGVRDDLARYDALVTAARTDPPTLVLTHGEPHPGNTMRTDGGWLLIDWDTALVAPPERDLWDLDPGDGTQHAAYTSATGTALRPDLLDLYRLRWDLTEIAACLARFHEPHTGTADDEETWTNLKELLPRPN